MWLAVTLASKTNLPVTRVQYFNPMTFQKAHGKRLE
jgi:hypothetical protein